MMSTTTSSITKKTNRIREPPIPLSSLFMFTHKLIFVVTTHIHTYIASDFLFWMSSSSSPTTLEIDLGSLATGLGCALCGGVLNDAVTVRIIMNMNNTPCRITSCF